jgi:7-cyano-7-deazaguanine reductase
MSRNPFASELHSLLNCQHHTTKAGLGTAEGEPPAAALPRAPRFAKSQARRYSIQVNNAWEASFMPTQPSKQLVVVPNPHPNKVYQVEMSTPEFTTLCPMTGQPDFATITIQYEPGLHLVELKSLKLYLWSFRNEGHFHEDVVNIILNDFVQAAKPRWAKVTGDFTVRGGISTKVITEYHNPEYYPEHSEPGR